MVGGGGGGAVKLFIYGLYLRGLDTFGRFSTMFYKEDNFCDILFSFLFTKSEGEQNLCFLSRPILKTGDSILTVA